MNRRNRVLTALGAIALGSTSIPAHAAEEDADYAKVCEWLSTQSADALRDFIRQNPDSDCVDVAAQLLAERSQPGAGVRAAMGARY